MWLEGPPRSSISWRRRLSSSSYLKWQSSASQSQGSQKGYQPLLDGKLALFKTVDLLPDHFHFLHLPRNYKLLVSMTSKLAGGVAFQGSSGIVLHKSGALAYSVAHILRFDSADYRTLLSLDRAIHSGDS